MKYLKMYESFFEKDLVDVNGERGRVISTDGDKVNVMIFKTQETLPYDESEVTKTKRCMGRCFKEVTKDDNGNRVVYCSGCDRVTKRL